MNNTQSLAHTTWECKYHVVWIPKYRRKKLFVEIRRELGPVLRELARQKESEILEGKLLIDHVHMLIGQKPDIALLDLRMPVVDGIGVVRWIKRSGLSTRTVILTIFRGESDIRQAIQAGANAYLIKDTSTREILKTIRCVYGGEARISKHWGQGLAPNGNSADLKPLELDILTLVVQGHDNRTIGSRLGLSTDAVKYHLRTVFSKLGVQKRAAAARQAIERSLVTVLSSESK